MQPCIAMYRGDPSDGDFMCYVRTWSEWVRFVDSVNADTHPYWANGVTTYEAVLLGGNGELWL